jgi:cell division protein FtsB
MSRNYLKISERIVEMTGIDIFDNTRKQEYVELRALACYIFREKMNMRWMNIANFFNSMGKAMDHATAIHLVNMYPTYTKDNPELLEIESCFVFEDNENYDEVDRVAYLKKKNEKLKENVFKLKAEVKELRKKPTFNLRDQNMLMLFKDIPDDKINEVVERIDLMKKSWSWKTKDKCQVIESSTSMDGMHW